MATDNGWRRADGPARTGQGAPARQRNARSPQKIFCGDFLLFSSVLFLSVKEKEPSESSGTRLGWPAAPARQRNAHSPQNHFAGLFFEKPRREKRVTDEGEGLPEGFRAIPSPIRFLFFGSFFSFPEKKERTIPPTAARTPRGGPPEGFRAIPSPIRFLFFGSFFSFPERKERTEKEKKRNVRAAAPPLARMRPNRGLFLI